MNAAEVKLETMDEKQQRILVIDDDPVIRKFMERIISDARKAGEERLWRIINHFSDGVILADAEGVVEMVNPAAVKLFGRNAEDFVGSSFGFPLLAGETSELDIISREGTLKVPALHPRRCRKLMVVWLTEE